MSSVYLSEIYTSRINFWAILEIETVSASVFDPTRCVARKEMLLIAR
jgi:hypothetical protein